MSWTVVKADQTRREEPREEKAGERVSEDKTRGKTAEKGITPVETESDETRIISDVEGGIKQDKAARRRSRRNKTENESKGERKFRKSPKR